MEFSQRPLSFMEFLLNNKHQAVNKMHLVGHKPTKGFSDNQHW